MHFTSRKHHAARALLFAALFSLAILPAAAQEPAPEPPPAESANPGKPEKILVPPGTKLPLVLHNSVSTRTAKPGDPLYFEVLFPIVLDGHIVVPAGSYVQGEVTEARRAGRVKGRAELSLRLNTMILPNGYTVDFRAFPTGAGTGGGETVDEEGRVKGDSDKGTDVGAVATTTSIGTGLGGAIGRSGKGAGIGAGMGAAAGLAAVMLTRGPDAELPRGTTLDVELDRALVLDASRINFTEPGQASSLAGPSNRQRQRRPVPIP